MTAPEPLSPAAQAVLDAFLSEWDVYAVSEARWATAAAIRAAADRSMNLIGDICHPKYIEGIEAASDFLERIAAELEA